MVIPLAASLLLALPASIMGSQTDLLLEHETTDTATRGVENKDFANAHIYNTLHTNHLFVNKNTVLGGKLVVNGTFSGSGSISGPDSSTPNAVARFADNTGTTLANSPVLIDNTGNITGVNTLTAQSVTAPTLNGTANNVLSVDGQSAASVAAATVLADAATSNNTYNSIIKRDSAGNFTTATITITANPTLSTDIATKEYTDLITNAPFTAKAPANAASITNISPLSGTPTLIDGISLFAGDRVLLLGQNDATENGLWELQDLPALWKRPLDFTSPPEIGDAYIFVQNGTTLGGTAWICTTPDAIIDTDALAFVPFPLKGQTTGANVGSGIGTIFKDKTGNYIHFKSLISGDHVTVTNNISGDDVSIATTGQSEAIPNTLILRDTSGNFVANTISASLTGTASENILRSGDSMTGILTLINGSPAIPSLQFAGSTNTGLSATTPNRLSFDTNGIERMSINSSGTVTINQFSSVGIVHNDASGELSSSLIVNTDIDAGANILDTKLASISTPGKVTNSATSATTNTPDTIVLRDNNGDFSAHIITAHSIIGTNTTYLARNGDSMLGTFTVINGSAAQPALAFVDSSNTGLSAQTTNRLSFDTNGVERMSINETGTVTIPGILVLTAGTATEPSLQFSNGTNTGISQATANNLAFNTNGVERINIDTNSIETQSAAFVIGNVMDLVSTQSLNITDEGSYAVTIENNTSLLIITYVTGVPIYVDITFPNAPYEGQLITIKAILDGLSNNLNLTYNYLFEPATEEVIILNPLLALNVEFDEPNRGTGGATVTYIYHTAATGFPKDGWYRYSRG